MTKISLTIRAKGITEELFSRLNKQHESLQKLLGGLVILVCTYATLLFSLMLVIGALFGLSTITSLTFSQIISGWLLYLLLPVAVLCLTLFGSVSLKAVSNGIFMIFIYILGSVGGMVEMIGQYVNNNSVIGTGIVISLVSPFQTIYSTMERVMVPNSELAASTIKQ